MLICHNYKIWLNIRYYMPTNASYSTDYDSHAYVSITLILCFYAQN